MCASRQTIKNVLNGRSRGVFQGKIEVARPAQKTDGYQMNQALLLSPDAEIDAKPELEIYADDVKCSHGATVGAAGCGPDVLFAKPGHSVAEQAKAMLVRAFLTEALDVVHRPGGADAAGRRRSRPGGRRRRRERFFSKVGHQAGVRRRAGAGGFPDPCGRLVRGKPLVFLDSAASAMKPRPVIDAMVHCDGDAVLRTCIAGCTG